ncbi:MAG: hypothetical protein FJW23_12540 [Acidimicrobiia bacterium]|nr:hypothetical protein [Acidimicrobiia bacterium]
MRVRFLVAVAVLAAVALIGTRMADLDAQGAEALTGVVSSEAEGSMEGVLVTARREGANHTVTVVSDAQGKYSFPRTHLEPGAYTLTTRASGYELASGGKTSVTSSSAASLNLTLTKASDPLAGASSLEIVNSMPGTLDQKDRLVYTALSCAYCHTFKRTVRSKHSPEQWPNVIRRMQSYYPDGTATSDDGRAGVTPEHTYGGSFGDPTPARREREVANPGQAPWGRYRGNELGEYLATVNLSDGRTKLPFEMEYLPRPKGKETRVIITQWDQPRRNTMTHDGIFDNVNKVFWYGDEAHQMVGKLDPKTHTFSEYTMPPVGRESLEGTRDIVVDKDGNPWFPTRIDGGAAVVSKFDVKTEKLTMVDGVNGQFVSIGGDGHVWTGMNVFRRANLGTMKMDRQWEWTKSPNVPNQGRVACYQISVDSKGNPWCTGYFGDVIIGVDKDSGEAKFWPVPTSASMPRRNTIDSQDRIWFAEYTGDKVGVFDTKTQQFREWALPYKYTTPYVASAPDAQGRVYAASNMTERVARVDTNTGEVVQYLIPTDFDSKKISIDRTTDRPVIWMANTRNARIIRIEPLDY